MKRIRLFFNFLGPRVGLLLLTAVSAGMVLSGVELALGYGIQAFLIAVGVADQALVSLPQWLPIHSLNSVLLFLLSVAVLRAIFQWLQIVLQETTQEQFKFEIRHRIIRWVFASRSVSSAEAATLFGERTTLAGAGITHLCTAVVFASTNIMLLAFLLTTSFKVTLLSGVIIAALAIPFRSLNQRVSRDGKGLSDSWESLNARLLRGIRNLLLIRTYGMEKKEVEASQEFLETYRRHRVSYHRTAAVVFASPQLIGVVLVCLVALLWQREFGLTQGILVSYLYILIRFLQNTSQIAYMASNFIFQLPQFKHLWKWWTRASAHLDQVKEQKELDHRAVGALGTTSTDGSRGSPGLANGWASQPVGWNVEGLKFKYPGATNELFAGLSFNIQPGSVVVVRGTSGVGKSTLLQILLGEFEPTEGNVWMKAPTKNAEHFEVPRKVREHLLSRVGYVGAESFILDGTIEQNLTYGLDKKPTPEQMKEALTLAECGFVDAMPEGINHYITEQGDGLSAGQKQRLSLARALLRNPTLLILDEATANLDMETEEKLVKTFAQLRGRMTVVAVTHRTQLQTIADQVLSL